MSALETGRGMLLPDGQALDHSYSMYDHVISKARLVAIGNCVIPELEAKGIALDSVEGISRGMEFLDMLGLGPKPDFEVIRTLAIPRQVSHN